MHTKSKKKPELASDFAKKTLAGLLKKAGEKSKQIHDLEPKFPVGNCDLHGEYAIFKANEDGSVSALAGGCQICKRQSAARKLLTESNTPKRFIDCDFDNYRTETAKQKHVLDRCKAYAFGFEMVIEKGTCLLLCGNPGTGKNHLATAISRHVLLFGYSALRIKAGQFLDEYWSKPFEQREQWIRSLADVDLLVIDEIGKSSNAKGSQDAFFRLIDARYEAVKPMLITTNLNRAELIETLGDASYDRLTQGGAKRLTLDWDSYRKNSD